MVSRYGGFLAGLLVLVFAAGVTGADFMGSSEVPLVDVLNAVDNGQLALFVNVAGLFGLFLVASHELDELGCGCLFVHPESVAAH